MNRHARRAQGRTVSRDRELPPGDGKPAVLEVLSLPPHEADCACGAPDEGGLVRFRMSAEGIVFDTTYTVETARLILVSLVDAIARAEGKAPS